MIDPTLKQRLMADIDRAEAEVVSTLQCLVQFPTVNPPGNEAAHQQYLAGELKALGLDVKLVEAVPGRPNLIAILKGTGGGKNLLHYAGHADVVDAGDEADWTFPPFSGQLHDGWIYGRGSVDHKAPIAASLAALRALIANGVRLKGDLIFLVPVDEECGSYAGTKYLLEQGLLYGDMGIYASAGFLEQVLISCSGSVRFEVEVRGVTAHGGWSHKGINAIEKASKLVLALQSMRFDKVNPLWKPTHEQYRLSPSRTGSMTVVSIQGSSPAGSVPDVCRVQASRRLVPNETVDEAKAQIEALLAELHEADPQFKAELHYISSVNGLNTAPDDPLVEHVSAAIRDIGLEPEIDGSSGGFDARWIVEALNIPFVSYGAGWNGPDGDLCLHKPNEAITVDNLMGMARAYAMIMMRICEVSAYASADG
jgi:succinyl-diaminopimelate desuccinylase